MPVYRVTFGFAQSIYSPTETYYTGDVTTSAVGGVIQKLLDARNGCLFASAKWIGVRVGLADGSRRSALFPPGTYTSAIAGIDLTVPKEGLLTVTEIEKRPDQARSCLQSRLGFDTDRSVIRYFALPADKVLYDEPASTYLAGDVVWKAGYEVFITELTSGRWFIKGRNRAAGFTEFPILDWTNALAAPTNLGVVLLTATAAPFAAGDTVAIKATRRRGTDKISYNGQYVIKSINTTLQPDRTIYYLANTEAGASDSIRKAGKIQKVGYQYYAIQRFYPLRAGVHKRGNSFGRVLGSRRTRPSLRDTLPAV